ncbi:tyrosine-type recombinase/integrase [Nonomuraea guangzhouensis]|uniref:Tyrosine-type recombinase/integrase n=1 Tax=Nonomuraea guangzhouensis TaxID=1291555 RepID=A0ABW4GBY5_9ACTN
MSLPRSTRSCRSGLPQQSEPALPSPRSFRDATHRDEVVASLGYEHLRRHDLRHTGLTWMTDAGVPIHVLRKIAGHGSLSTTQRYLHPDNASLAAAGSALSAHLSASWSRTGPKLKVI